MYKTPRYFTYKEIINNKCTEHCTVLHKNIPPVEQKVTPFPSLRCKIQAYMDEQREEKVFQWGNSFQFSTPPVTQTNPRKRAPGKIRVRWSNKARYNPTKMTRPKTLDLSVTDMDMMDSDSGGTIFSQIVQWIWTEQCFSFASNPLYIPHPKSQTRQMEIGLGNKQKHRNQ